MCVNGVNATDITWAEELLEKPPCIHWKTYPYLEEEHEDELIHHGDGAAANRETPRTICFVLCHLAYHHINSGLQCKKFLSVWRGSSKTNAPTSMLMKCALGVAKKMKKRLCANTMDWNQRSGRTQLAANFLLLSLSFPLSSCHFCCALSLSSSSSPLSSVFSLLPVASPVPAFF